MDTRKKSQTGATRECPAPLCMRRCGTLAVIYDIVGHTGEQVTGRVAAA
jgi:hypothetical protein